MGMGMGKGKGSIIYHLSSNALVGSWRKGTRANRDFAIGKFVLGRSNRVKSRDESAVFSVNPVLTRRGASPR